MDLCHAIASSQEEKVCTNMRVDTENFIFNIRDSSWLLEAFYTSTDADWPSLRTEDHINDIKVALQRFIPVSIELISSKRSMSTWKRKTESFLRLMGKKRKRREKVGSKMTVRKENREGQLDLLEVCFYVVSPVTSGPDGKSTQLLQKTICRQQQMYSSHFYRKRCWIHRAGFWSKFFCNTDGTYFLLAI